MSAEALSWALHQSKAKHSARLVLIVMADSAGQHGFCTDSIGGLSRRAGLYPNTVKKALRTLEQIGEIRCAITQDGRVLYPVPPNVERNAEDGRAVYQVLYPSPWSPRRKAA
jgi:hypothetical protein